MTVLHHLSWFLVTLLNQKPLHSTQTINPDQEKLLWKEQKTREEEPQLRRPPLWDGQHWCQQYIYLQINGSIGVRVSIIKNIYEHFKKSWCTCSPVHSSSSLTGRAAGLGLAVCCASDRGGSVVRARVTPSECVAVCCGSWEKEPGASHYQLGW